MEAAAYGCTSHLPCGPYDIVAGMIVWQGQSLACLLTLLWLRSRLWPCSNLTDSLPDCLQETSHLHGLIWRHAQHCLPGMKVSCSLLCGGCHALCISLDALHRIITVDSCLNVLHGQLEAHHISIQEPDSLQSGCGMQLQCTDIAL